MSPPILILTNVSCLCLDSIFTERSPKIWLNLPTLVLLYLLRVFRSLQHCCSLNSTTSSHQKCKWLIYEPKRLSVIPLLHLVLVNCSSIRLTAVLLTVFQFTSTSVCWTSLVNVRRPTSVLSRLDLVWFSCWDRHSRWSGSTRSGFHR